MRGGVVCDSVPWGPFLAEMESDSKDRTFPALIRPATSPINFDDTALREGQPQRKTHTHLNPTRSLFKGPSAAPWSLLFTGAKPQPARRGHCPLSAPSFLRPSAVVEPEFDSFFYFLFRMGVFTLGHNLKLCGPLIFIGEKKKKNISFRSEVANHYFFFQPEYNMKGLLHTCQTELKTHQNKSNVIDFNFNSSSFPPANNTCRNKKIKKKLKQNKTIK